MQIKYDLSTNFDDELIKRVAGFNRVKSLYGKLASDIVGGGRPTFNLPKVSRAGLEKHIHTAHENKIEFNYLFNALCCDNREFIGNTHKQMKGFIKYLEEIGVDMITVGSPFMLEMVKENSSLPVSVSVYNDIDSLDRIQTWEKLGADELTLHYSFNRDFNRLRDAIKNSKANLRLIANNTCLHECISRTNHANCLAHSSQSGHSSGGFFLDFYSLNCGKEKLENPAKLIAADWIRPEDVHYYAELCEILGKTNLSLKLTDRSRPTDWLVRTTKAYSQESYDGNLFDILNYRNSEFAKVSKMPFIKAAIFGKAKADKMMQMQKAIFPPKIYLDNKSLNGFFEVFVKGKSCEKENCKIDSCNQEQAGCNYCKTIADKFLRFDGGEEARQKYLGLAEESLKSLKTGKIF